MRHSRFDDSNYEQTYYSEGARIQDYLRDFRDEVPGHVYDSVFKSFMNGDKKTLADLLAKVCANLNELKEELKRKNDRIAQLEKQLERLQQENSESSKIINEIYRSGLGENLFIKSLYLDKGMSLNKIAKIVDKDKNTVKKRLMKMGVAIRGSDHRTP